MANTTITSANSILSFTVASLFPTPVQIQGFSSDKAFTMDALDLAEIQMGVDGRMTAGFTPNPSKQDISLQADSPSRGFFATVVAAMKSSREIYYFSGTLLLPSTGESFTMTRGILTRAMQMPSAQKVLTPVDFEITWEGVSRSLL